MQGIPGPIASLINLFWGYSGFNIRLYAAFASSLSCLYFGFIGYLFALYWILIGSFLGPYLVFQQTSLAARSIEFS